VLGVYAGEGMTLQKWNQRCLEDEKTSDQVVNDTRPSYTFDCDDSEKLLGDRDSADDPGQAGNPVQVGRSGLVRSHFSLPNLTEFCR
jgi:hypothetical protein